ncbi:MAG TPA: pyruvate kinase [Candidatus Limnocylindria bacterium]|nr:pyruvate kinase [Candidatus Limnocylindria bacterium]
MSGRRAKIVCTLGPATATSESVRALIDAGMDIARLNLSHGTRDDHARAYRWVREASDAAGRAVGVLLDLQGPKIRLGNFTRGSVTLHEGEDFVITTEPISGDWRRASTTYPGLARDVRAGDTLLLDDGLVRLEVLASDGQEVVSRVIEGGVVSDHKGINLPGVTVSAPALTAKDREDLRFALELRVDLVALSFVRGPEDVQAVHEAMDEVGARLPVIAKLEKPEAVANLEAIVQAFDGVMVARGDLGVEIALEQVPLVQKRAVQLAREYAKPVIVATQMLESMIRHPRPTRAEASDVANAVLDGADALMLSGETSVGEYPIESVTTMARIIAASEEGRPGRQAPLERKPSTRQEGIASAATKVASDLEARALVAFTETGSTARRMASHREPIPLLAFTPDPLVRSQLALVWGIETFVVARGVHTDDLITQVDRALLELGRGQPGDLVVIVAGVPPGTTGTTNMLRVHRLGGS